MNRTAPSSALAALLAGSAFAAVCSDVMPVAGAEVPKRVLLFPMGTHKTRDGRGPYTLSSKEHGHEVVAATIARLGKADFPFDYDHQMVFASVPAVGGRAEASGWSAKAFEVDDAGVWANVDWTDDAAAALSARKYRYISPYFTHGKDGRLKAFVNAALVNQPALDLEAVAASFLPINDPAETPMKAIALALGLAEDADEATIVASIQKSSAVLTAACSALAITAGSDETAVTAAIGALKAGKADEPDPKAFVPKAAFDALNATVASLQETAITEKVDAAVGAGQLAPAMRDWGMRLAKADPAEFSAFCSAAPVIVAPGKKPLGDKTAGGEIVLDDDDRAVCAMLGVSEAEYLETRKAEAV